MRLRLIRLAKKVQLRFAHNSDSQRGDVPGWVLVTVMSAGLVAAILLVFKPAVVTAVMNALEQVTAASNG